MKVSRASSSGEDVPFPGAKARSTLTLSLSIVDSTVVLRLTVRLYHKSMEKSILVIDRELSGWYNKRSREVCLHSGGPTRHRRKELP